MGFTAAEHRQAASDRRAHSLSKVGELVRLLDSMELPSQRTVLTTENLRWLRRNLGIMNPAGPELDRARVLVLELERDRANEESV